MQTIINSENTLVQTSAENSKLEKRIILEVEGNTTTKNERAKASSKIKYSYPTNGLYGLL